MRNLNATEGIPSGSKGEKMIAIGVREKTLTDNSKVYDLFIRDREQEIEIPMIDAPDALKLGANLALNFSRAKVDAVYLGLVG